MATNIQPFHPKFKVGGQVFSNTAEIGTIQAVRESQELGMPHRYDVIFDNGKRSYTMDESKLEVLVPRRKRSATVDAGRSETLRKRKRRKSSVVAITPGLVETPRKKKRRKTRAASVTPDTPKQSEVSMGDPFKEKRMQRLFTKEETGVGEDVWYKGTVAESLTVNGVELWLILYDDGDKEHLEAQGVEDAIAAYEEQQNGTETIALPTLDTDVVDKNTGPVEESIAPDEEQQDETETTTHPSVDTDVVDKRTSPLKQNDDQGTNRGWYYRLKYLLAMGFQGSYDCQTLRKVVQQRRGQNTASWF